MIVKNRALLAVEDLQMAMCTVEVNTMMLSWNTRNPA